MMDTYSHGYTKALLDVRDYIKDHSDALKVNKLYNRKGIEKLIDALINRRGELMRTGTVQLRYDTALKEFVSQPPEDPRRPV